MSQARADRLRVVTAASSRLSPASNDIVISVAIGSGRKGAVSLFHAMTDLL
jgi:hypothetical protein